MSRAKKCPICHYISGKLAHSYWCSPALRRLVRATEAESDRHHIRGDNGEVVHECPCVFCRAVRAWRKKK